jgi:glycosyltransferase involved in cell wall biosynthesis
MEPTKKILSVIIPAYNSHAFIKNALETLDYKYSDLFDVIIIDDLSPIPLEPEIRDYLAQHNNISIHRHEQNLNWGGAVETGFKLANSLYVKILDSDDQFDTETFVKYILVLKNYAEKDIDIFITNTSCYLGDEF